jgi:hypothetical protein
VGRGYTNSKKTKMAKCVFCGNSAAKMNSEDQPVCKQHQSYEPKEVACGHCGMPMQIKEGSRGFFWACLGYPQCQNTFDIEEKLDED